MSNSRDSDATVGIVDNISGWVVLFMCVFFFSDRKGYAFSMCYLRSDVLSFYFSVCLSFFFFPFFFVFFFFYIVFFVRVVFFFILFFELLAYDKSSFLLNIKECWEPCPGNTRKSFLCMIMLRFLLILLFQAFLSL